MNCIIVNDDPQMKNTIAKLIDQSADLELLYTFNSTSEALIFIRNNKVDVVFFDIQMYDFDNIGFIYEIPEPSFVIYIPEFSPFANTEISTKTTEISETEISKRFQKGIAEARNFHLKSKQNSKIPGDYYVI